MATSKNLKSAVKAEVKEAATDAKTGNEQTIAEGPKTLRKAAGPADLPTGARRSHPAD